MDLQDVREWAVRSYYSEGGLRKWVKDNWVDIANKKSDGSYPKCGRSGGEKEKNYPKCVPIAKARAMSKGQRAGAVRRKQAKANTGPTPSRAATFAKKEKEGIMRREYYSKGTMPARNKKNLDPLKGWSWNDRGWSQSLQKT